MSGSNETNGLKLKSGRRKEKENGTVRSVDEETVRSPSVYLHLRAAVLEPELDLARVEAEPLAELAALLLVRVRALLEQPTYANATQHDPSMH
jgi:hypothetical protein